MKLRHTLAIAALGALVFGCVEHRPVRNGLRDVVRAFLPRVPNNNSSVTLRK